jgi:hypothetical protein
VTQNVKLHGRMMTWLIVVVESAIRCN